MKGDWQLAGTLEAFLQVSQYRDIGGPSILTTSVLPLPRPRRRGP